MPARVGDVLTAYTTHMKIGSIRRNGGPISDQATIRTHFPRHGDMLTAASLLDAPIYLSEPCHITRTFAMTSALLNSGGPPCITGDEGLEEGSVPHYPSGK